MSSVDFEVLNDALLSDSQEIINFLLVKKKKLSKESLLRMSLHKRNHSILELLLQRGADVNHKDENGKSVLELAIEYAFPEFVKSLLDHGANLDTTAKISIDKYNTEYSLLHKAVHVGNLEIIELLLKKGLNVNQKTEIGVHPLACKCQHNCYYYMMQLDSDYAFCKTLSLLDVAIICNPKKGNKIIDLLCKNGAVVESRNENYLPLHLAVLESADTTKIDKLLEYGANINSVCEHLLYTPLAHAVLKEDEKTVSHLLKKGATFFKRTINSVFHKLVVRPTPKTEDFLGLLLDSGADINSKNEKGETSLHVVISTVRNTNYLKLLADFGSDINLRDEEGNTPLHCAIENNNNLALRVLIEYEADVFALNKSGKTPLERAIQKIDVSNLALKLFSFVSSKAFEYGIKDMFSINEINVFLIIQVIIVKESAEKFVEEEVMILLKSKLFYLYKTFLKGLLQMRVNEIEANISYFDLLSKSASEVEPCVSKRIIESLENSEIDKEFPLFEEMIKMRISKIKERMILVQYSVELFKFLFRANCRPPNMICKKICSFLSWVDLINLWRVCKRPGESLSTLLDRCFE